MRYRKVVVLGFDGLDPLLTEDLLAAGSLPHLSAVRAVGGYGRVATTFPAQTPVAWSTFAVGVNPGGHGIFDFLARDPSTYRPRISLYRHEQKNRFLPPKAVNLRQGRPVWERLSHSGIPSVVLRHPCTYPPTPFRGRLLAGVGVPDVRGGFGSGTCFTSNPEVQAGEGERVERVDLGETGRGTVLLSGPLGPDGRPLSLALDLEVQREEGRLVVTGPAAAFSFSLREGEWSAWVELQFRHGLLQSVRGLVRFFLVRLRPFCLFASAVQFHPDSPLFPISHPWDYAGELKRVQGPFATLGMAEEHNAVTNGRIDEEAFLAQCGDIMRERRAMMHYELQRHDRGLFYCLFDTPDRVQHLFWRFREPDHPANGVAPPMEGGSRVIEDYYRLCDEVVGEVLEHVDGETLLVILSDHGFGSFRREVHLNRWLVQEGYLALKPGMEPEGSDGDLLMQVDWGRTRAYALGLAGLFLNLRGREGEGIVAPEDARYLRSEIASRLGGLLDPARGRVAVRYAVTREEVYSGACMEEAPDVLVAYAPGYRTASAAAMGGVGPALFTDNQRRWSGDHVVDPAAVPGVLFMNAPFRSDAPRLVDLAPTLLQALGAPLDEDLEGGSLLP